MSRPCSTALRLPQGHTGEAAALRWTRGRSRGEGWPLNSYPPPAGAAPKGCLHYLSAGACDSEAPRRAPAVYAPGSGGRSGHPAPLGTLMHVVADASPLRYCILIGHIDLLPTHFTQIIIPRTVLGDLHPAQTPPVVRRWMHTCLSGVSYTRSVSPLPQGWRCRGQGNVMPWRSRKSCALLWYSSTKIKDTR
jgi:hypothetical protein